ncbi:hypothetical protein PNEG_03083 [Pneumocystis murina B123]|uniref:DNA mismatch repair protein n=1 Tax=Pneumocystis murina (strain B123) TaxID=1069680 RepID=M7NN01_PNEMU|nr:hypothetical protein PNEG_03083 [Pneumocystis murina B123]EMR08607.1 hypothetical protein PNEG_03083 [Pneumocystis murina B123]
MEMKKKAEKMTQQTLLGFIKKSEKKKETNSLDFPYTPSKSSDLSSSTENCQDISFELETELLNLGETSFNGIFTPITLNIDKSKREESGEKENSSSFHVSPSFNRSRKKLNYKEDSEDEDDIGYISVKRKKSKVIHHSDDEFEMTVSENENGKNDESDSCSTVSSNQEENHLNTRKPRKLTNKDKKRNIEGKSIEMGKNMVVEDRYLSIDSPDKKLPFTSLFNTQKKSSEISNHDNEENYKFLLPEYRRDADGNSPSSPNYDERTLYIPPSTYKSFKPFEKQYWDIKSKFMDTLVFFQKGKFYELYQIDADIGHQLFNLKMTDRVGTMRMVGVPEANYEYWASKFIAKGFKIARVDQLESALGKEMRDKISKVKDEKVVRRELVHVLTSGTLVNEGIIASDMSTYCMAIKEEYEINSSVISYGICFVDAAAGNFKITYFKDDLSRTKLYTLITQIKPKELILEKANVTPKTIKLLKNSGINETIWNFIKPGIEFWDEHTTESQFLMNNYFKDNDFNNWPPALKKARNYPIAMSSVGGLVWYLKTLKMDKSLCSLGNFEWYDLIQKTSSLILDGQTLKNLEIFSNSHNGGLDGTLIKLLNRCTTPFGKRLFRLWLCHPLRSVNEINERLDVVELLSDLSIRKFIIDSFKTLPDLERMISRIHAKHCKSKDFIRVLEGFNTIYEILDYLSKNLKQDNGLLWKIINDIPNLVDVLNDWQKMFDWKKCKDEDILIPNPGTEKDFDNSQNKIKAIEDELYQMERDYRKQLKSPQITFRDIGKEIYQIEIPKSIEVPSSWVKLSSTKSVNRYWSPELKVKVRQLQEAREAHKTVIKNVQDSFFSKFDENYFQWLKVVKSIAYLDCLTSLSISSMEFAEPSCRPQIIDSEYSILEFDELRHPCIIPSVSSSFIPNNIKLGGSKDDPTIALLTGPNMAGKSTLLRQTCIAVILAQLGCWVPARRAVLTPMDSIRSRLGANDNIFGSQSTFMVELSETKRIIEESTSKSLVILDELGRGTSTYDGLAIAYSTLHKLSTYVGCLGFFSTHYHSLVKDFENHPKIAACYMAAHVDEDERKITFLYELRPGVSSKSYGMNVAAMAGIPEEIIKNAEIAAKKFEISSQSTQSNKTNYKSCISLASQSDFSWLMKLSISKDPIPSTPDLKRQLYVIANTF